MDSKNDFFQNFRFCFLLFKKTFFQFLRDIKLTIHYPSIHSFLESVSKKKIEFKKLKLRIYQDVSAKRTDEYA